MNQASQRFRSRGEELREGSQTRLKTALQGASLVSRMPP